MQTRANADEMGSDRADGLRGVLTLLACSALMIAIAYGAMLAVTAPDGWATRAAQSTMQDAAPVAASLAAEAVPTIYADAH